ncbi:hypothetical protein ACFFHM_24415 [Halalkalibacter kiskunsagensis]|uniref:Uncharacterized protein n=1 Tax=Halalkalibacter kiskunsagensis TaxID=1548599 RepID=A0ABV6KJW1_9BACI
MKHKKRKDYLHYSALFDHILLLENISRKEKGKSPTIAEVSAIVGDSEEHILECMELGRPDAYKTLH